jgi:antitoxin component of RelBE/YafQ-DinJ toxin-antitoxin module
MTSSLNIKVDKNVRKAFTEFAKETGFSETALIGFFMKYVGENKELPMPIATYSDIQRARDFSKSMDLFYKQKDDKIFKDLGEKELDEIGDLVTQ